MAAIKQRFCSFDDDGSGFIDGDELAEFVGESCTLNPNPKVNAL